MPIIKRIDYNLIVEKSQVLFKKWTQSIVQRKND